MLQNQNSNYNKKFINFKAWEWKKNNFKYKKKLKLPILKCIKIEKTNQK